jgi:hypothetical protein
MTANSLMAGSSWPASEVTQDYLQNLISKGCMIAVELATYLVPAGPESLAPVEGFIVVCAAFYVRGFDLLSHRCLCSCLRSYGLELHHLTPSWILHMAAFVTLCVGYIGIEPALNQWRHFFWAWLQHDSGVGAMFLGSVDILVRSDPRPDSYFSFPQPDSPTGWWKVWFLKDEADALLPMFMGGCSVPHPDWEHGVARADFPPLQPIVHPLPPRMWRMTRFAHTKQCVVG